MKILHLSLGLACVLACAETDESIGTLVHQDGPRSSWASSLEQRGRAEALLGLDGGGRLALVRLADGEVVTRFALGDLNGVPDVSVFSEDDGSLSHLALLSHDEEEHAGLLRLVPASNAGFARGVEVAEVEGQTRTLALSGGALVMHHDLGQRWTFARMNSGFQVGAACPMPASIIAIDSSESYTAVVALAWSPDEEPVLVDAKLVNGQWQCAILPVVSEEPLSRSARGTLVPGVGRVLVDVGAHVRVALLGANVGPFSASSFEAARIEHVEPWVLEERSGVVVLTTNPTAVSVLALQRDGDDVLIVDGATVLLPTVTESPWFSRELVVSHDRVFVATASGLVGFELGLAPALGLFPLAVSPDLAALRGPLVAVPKLPPALRAEVGGDGD